MSVRRPIPNLAITSIDDVTRCINLASLLELAGWPKPGNVHRTQNFKDTTFEHFLAGITAIQPNFKRFCEKIYQASYNKAKDYGSINLGLFYKDATKEMIKWQSGGNVLLGHILILTPLAVATMICLKRNMLKF
ncbi:MAG: triphosphoribosyl-dephospho-CoA synthase, partial [Promethearchaeota archaeon]